jgi:hypothetical protein
MQQFLQDVRDNLPLELVWIFLGFIFIEVIYNGVVRPYVDNHRRKRKVELRRKRFEEQKRDFLTVHAFKTGKRDKTLAMAVALSLYTKSMVFTGVCFIFGLVAAFLPQGLLAAPLCLALGFYFMRQAVVRYETLKTWSYMYEDYDKWKELFAKHGVIIDDEESNQMSQ